MLMPSALLTFPARAGIPALMSDAERELQAMAEAGRALEPLEAAEAARVVRWLGERLGGAALAPGLSFPDPASPDAASLVAACAPHTETERTLAIAYWFQVVKGTAELDAQVLNRALRDLGLRVSNITKALTRLMAGSPQLVFQVSKSGGSRQARERYRLTGAGIEKVRAMLRPAENRTAP